MYNLWNRVNAVFFYGVTALFFAAAASNVTTLWFTPRPVVSKLSIHDLRAFKAMKDPMVMGHHINDRAVFTFDLEADLSGVFNWNVKQLFVFVTANYKTKTNAVNEVVIWDKVLDSKAASRLDVSRAHVKYPLIDQGKELRGVPVSLTLHWDVMPITGKLYQATRGNFTVALPAGYCSEGSCVLEEPIAVDVDTGDAKQAPRRKGKAAAAA